jgi:hypothetical protein
MWQHMPPQGAISHLHDSEQDALGAVAWQQHNNALALHREVAACRQLSIACLDSASTPDDCSCWSTAGTPKRPESVCCVLVTALCVHLQRMAFEGSGPCADQGTQLVANWLV